MTPRFELPQEDRLQTCATGSEGRALKNFRYVVGSVNEDALRVWSDLWEQFRDGVTPAGMLLPQMEQGFTPPCGWAEFLEKFWLLKHYLDYIHRFCREQERES